MEGRTSYFISIRKWFIKWAQQEKKFPVLGLCERLDLPALVVKGYQVLDRQASRSAACVVKSNCFYTTHLPIYLISLPDYAREQALQKCKITHTAVMQEERKSF